MLSLEKVSFSYSPDTDPTLKEIELEVKKGEFIAILGANGSGKTTLARILGGLALPTGGCLKFNGEIPGSRDFRPGILLSNPEDQFFAPVVEEDIAFGLENRGVPSEQIGLRVREVLEELNLSRFSRREVQTLSAGQQQKTALASLVALRPDLIILDEPFAYLDLKEQRDMAACLEDLRRRSKVTVIMFTHYLYWGLRTDRFYLLRNSRLSAPRFPADILDHLDGLEGIMIPEIVRLRHLLKKAEIKLPVSTMI
ncbi:MAG: energy-coupling factor ABC transporter ATP-binding protein [bacterium]